MKNNKQPANQKQKSKDVLTHRPDQGSDKKKLTEVTEVIDSLP
ncbi:MAG: hypothetical protein K0R55_2059 [Sporomusa sp.]|jgi:hypothetical protein|nr:hypothetical protein [Sporomusa sp.]